MSYGGLGWGLPRLIGVGVEVLRGRKSAIRELVTACVVSVTSVTVLSINASSGGAVPTPEIRQLASTSSKSDASSPEELVMLGTVMYFRAYRNDVGWEL